MDSGCPDRSVGEERLHTSCGHRSLLGHRLVCWVSVEEEAGVRGLAELGSPGGGVVRSFLISVLVLQDGPKKHCWLKGQSAPAEWAALCSEVIALMGGAALGVPAVPGIRRDYVENSSLSLLLQLQGGWDRLGRTKSCF